MTKREEIVAQVLEASGGKVVGRIRLQKMIYLLQQLGLGTDFKFSYHHYGPYSEEASVAIQRAIAIDRSISEKPIPSSYGGFYSEFNLLRSSNAESVGNLPKRAACQYASSMKEATSVLLELAATIHWLKHKEKVVDWQTELRLRKPGKASSENIGQAVDLLFKLNLAA